MNSNFPDLLVNGLFIGLSIQLFIIGLYLILNRTQKSIILGLYCCTICVGFLYTVWLPSVKTDFIYNAVGAYKHMFWPALIFLYIKLSIPKIDNFRTIKEHLWAPIVVQIVFLIIKFGFPHAYKMHESFILDLLNIFILFSYLFYLSRIKSVFVILKSLLKPNIYKRYLYFYCIACAYGILIMLESFLSYVVTGANYEKVFYFLSQQFYPIITFVFNLFMLVFAFVEAPKLKTLVFGKNIYNSYNNLKFESSIKNFIRREFDDHKIYTDSNFDIQSYLQNEEFALDDLRKFIKSEHNVNLNTYVNGKRISEFKRLITQEEHLKYDINGVANRSGFSSKATFYRNFKKFEGITPKEYLDSRK